METGWGLLSSVILTLVKCDGERQRPLDLSRGMAKEGAEYIILDTAHVLYSNITTATLPNLVVGPGQQVLNQYPMLICFSILFSIEHTIVSIEWVLP